MVRKCTVVRGQVPAPPALHLLYLQPTGGGAALPVSVQSLSRTK
jgi:hypothetical protein